MRSLAVRVGFAELNRLPTHTAQLEFRPRDLAHTALASAAGLDPASPSSEGWRSIRLSDAAKGHSSPLQRR
jgi:hypothetical protein